MATAAAHSAPFATLRDAKFLSLTTYRKDGTPVATPVWHVMAGDRIYVGTTAHSGKIKRLRREGRVTIAPCTGKGEVVGEAVEARARVLPSGEADVARRALRRRNGLQARLAELFYRLRGWQHAFIEITPA
jgi:PPOX class probable F420-dependent enzyme